MLRKDFLVLNSILIIYLIAITSSLPFSANHELLTFTEDAKQYMAVGDEFFNFNARGFSNVRPFLYPLFLKITYGIGGAKGVWLVQLGFWIASANFLFFSLKRYSKNLIPGILAVVFFAMNLTLIALTYHALTEVATVFLLSWLIYILTSENHESPACILKIISLSVLLTLLKPLFLYFSLAVIIFGTVIYLRKIIAQPKLAALLFVILSPLLLQYSVMKIKYGTWQLSEIGDRTLRTYLVAEGYQQIEGLERKKAIEAANNLSGEELKKRIAGHSDLYFSNYVMHIKHNVAGDPLYLKIKPEWLDQDMLNYQSTLNVRYLNWIKLIALLSTLVFTHQVFTRRLKRNLLMYVPLVLLTYILSSSGISFLQGDRLTIIALPAGIFALLMPLGYSLIIFREKVSGKSIN